MKQLIIAFVAFTTLSASATTLLDCYPRKGKFEIQEIQVGSLLIQPHEVIWFQQLPVFENLSFNPKTAKTEPSRTGNWVTYELVRELEEEIVTLQVEDTGKMRRAYLTRESTPFAQDPFFDVLMLKCIER
jgi:hypothetical protein